MPSSPSQPGEGEIHRGHDYILPRPELRPGFVNMPQIMYERSQRIRATEGESLGQIFDPYFNRNWEHFCSHQHTPNKLEPSGCDCGVRHGNILYFSHPVSSMLFMGMFRRLSNSLCMHWISIQRNPHHKTTADFFNAMNANHQRNAIRSLSASRPSFSSAS